jgi:hypothetical protein
MVEKLLLAVDLQSLKQRLEEIERRSWNAEEIEVFLQDAGFIKADERWIGYEDSLTILMKSEYKVIQRIDQD